LYHNMTKRKRSGKFEAFVTYCSFTCLRFSEY
jgi:hypothetical protein